MSVGVIRKCCSLENNYVFSNSKGTNGHLNVVIFLTHFRLNFVTGRMVSSEMLRRVALVRTDVSEELSASFISVGS
jgi:hypothetical protein